MSVQAASFFESTSILKFVFLRKSFSCITYSNRCQPRLTCVYKNVEGQIEGIYLRILFYIFLFQSRRVDFVSNVTDRQLQINAHRRLW